MATRAKGLTSTKQRLVEQFEETLDMLIADTNAPDVDLPGLPPRPTPTERAAIAARNEARLAAARAEVYDASWSREQVIDRLQVHTNSISNWLRDRRVIAIDGPDGTRFPAWQFDLDADKPLLPGIDMVVAAWPGGVVSLSLWMVRPNPSLHGRPPVDLLRDSEADHLAEVMAHLW